jgi:hypothetical protein
MFCLPLSQCHVNIIALLSVILCLGLHFCMVWVYIPSTSVRVLRISTSHKMTGHEYWMKKNLCFWLHGRCMGFANLSMKKAKHCYLLFYHCLSLFVYCQLQTVKQQFWWLVISSFCVWYRTVRCNQARSIISQ